MEKDYDKCHRLLREFFVLRKRSSGEELVAKLKQMRARVRELNKGEEVEGTK